jgi:hypothetical protein
VPERVTICTPATGANVPTDFQADGTLEDPDTDLQSCDVNGKQMDSKVVNFPYWTAFFTNVPVSVNQVPLTAMGNRGGIDQVWVTVSNPPPGAPGAGTDVCISVQATDAVPQAALERQQNPELKRRDMLRHLRVKRRVPARPGGYALRLEFRGTGKARFIVGGTLATPGDLVEKCFAGPHQAQRILNKDGEWQAVFENVLPGAHVLEVETRTGVKDQAPILIEVKD